MGKTKAKPEPKIFSDQIMIIFSYNLHNITEKYLTIVIVNAFHSLTMGQVLFREKNIGEIKIIQNIL